MSIFYHTLLYCNSKGRATLQGAKESKLPEQLALLDQPGGHIHQVLSLHVPNLQVFSFSVEHLNSEKKLEGISVLHG